VISNRPEILTKQFELIGREEFASQSESDSQASKEATIKLQVPGPRIKTQELLSKEMIHESDSMPIIDTQRLAESKVV